MEKLRKSCRVLLSTIDRAVAHYEEELALLRQQRGILENMLGAERVQRKKGAPANVLRQVSSGETKRVKWSDVLATLPPRFRPIDVMQNKDAARKGRLQIDPAINRWLSAKLVRRVSTGLYEKVPVKQAKAKAA